MDQNSKKIYTAIVWVDDQAGDRIEVEAANPEEARSVVEDLYGKEIVATIWNEEDANKPR